MESKESGVVSLKRASEADIDVLIEIENSVIPTPAYSPMTSEKAWKRELSENDVFLILAQNVAVGSIAYALKTHESLHINGIIVRPEYQGKGIATKVIQDVLVNYPEATHVDLVTHPDNQALKLYENLGFKVTERIEDYFGDGEPRLVLVRTR